MKFPPFSRTRILWSSSIVLAAIFIIVTAAHGQSRTPAMTAAIDVKLLASLVHYAKTHRIALDDFEITNGSAAQTAQPGDGLTVLFAIIEGEVTVRQWLVEVRAAALTEREAGTKPGTGAGILSLFQSSLKTDTGHEYSFEQSPVALEIQTCGPFTETSLGKRHAKHHTGPRSRHP